MKNFILKIKIGLHLFIAIAMLMPFPAAAQEVSIIVSVPVVVTAKLTTHPDNFYPNTPVCMQMTSPVVSDLDCDWMLDIVSAGYNDATKKSSVFIWNRNGVIKTGWPVEVDGRIETMPAVGDLDNDGDLEIVASVINNSPLSGGKVYAWHHDATICEGYPIDTNYKPGMPLIGDVVNGFEEEPLVTDANMGMAVCDINLDGKKEVIMASPYGMDVLNGSNIPVQGWPVQLLTIGTPVAGDVDGDGKPEVFLAVKTPEANYIYGWHNDGTAIEGWPVNCAGIVNAPGSFLSIADVTGDGIAEILTGSKNGWLVIWNLNGTVYSSIKMPIEDDKSATNEIYQPIAGDINNDNNIEIIATSKYGNIYCYDNNGNPVAGYPQKINYELSQGAVLVDIEQDSAGDSLNPANDMELLYTASDGMVHSIDLSGNFDPKKIQWGMPGFNSRNSNNYLRDWDNAGWFIFDNDPSGAEINTVYDWNRGSRVVELNGAGLNNGYVFKNIDGTPLNSKNTTLQWSMLYSTPFYIYVSVDTIKGKRYLMYTPTEGNELADPTGIYIHHGLGGSATNGRWHTFSRDLAQDLKDADQSNQIIDINAVYVQGSGRIDDVLLAKGVTCIDLLNLALTATVKVSSGNGTAMLINDGDETTKWTSGGEHLPWVGYTWANPQKINKIVIKGVTGTTNGVLFITDSKGNVYEVNININGSNPIEVVFKAIEDVKSIVAVFDGDNGSISIGDIEVYNDPNVDEEMAIPQVTYSAEDYIDIKDGYLFDPIKNEYWMPHGVAYIAWNNINDQWQTPVELKNDLYMMAQAGINAIRADFKWQNIEITEGNYDYSKYDMLLEEAQANGIKVFPVINYQGAAWLSNNLIDANSADAVKFIDFVQELVSRYYVGGDREDLGDVIAGWIVGNFYSYIDETNIDLSEDMVAKLTALAVGAVKDVDADHLVSYEALIADGNQIENTAKILKACGDAGVQLNFWSIDFYPQVLDINKLATGKALIEKAISDSGLPVMVAKTGFTSTDGNITEERQAKLIRNTIWESLVSGAIGICSFAWRDSEWNVLSDAEKGFGVIRSNGDVKPAYNYIKETFAKIDTLNLKSFMPTLVGKLLDINLSNNPVVIINHRASADNSKILFGLMNYDSDQIVNAQVSSQTLIGKSIKDIINNVVLETASDATIAQEINADDYRLLLVYNSTDNNGDPVTDPLVVDPIVNPVVNPEPVINPIPQNVGNNTDGSSSAQSLTSYAGTPTSNQFSSSNPLAAASSSANNNAYQMIGAGGVGMPQNTEEKKSLENPSSNNSGSSLSQTSSANLGIRTYVGNGSNVGANATGSDKSSFIDNSASKTLSEVAPVEQFQAVMDTSSDQEMGITRVTPQIVPQAKLENIIKAPVVNQASSPATSSSSISGIVSAVVEGAKNFWTNLFKTVKLAGSLVSRKYA
jgi:hypothetical protein